MSLVPDLKIVVDAGVAVLLLATIAYAAILNPKSTALRDAEEQMQDLATRLIEPTDQAGSRLDSLKAHARDSGAALGRQIQESRGLTDDLAFMIERGNSLVNRIDRGRGSSGAGEIGETSGDAVSSAEAALLQSLQGVR